MFSVSRTAVVLECQTCVGEVTVMARAGVRPMGMASWLPSLLLVTLLLPVVEPGKFKYVLYKDFSFNLYVCV